MCWHVQFLHNFQGTNMLFLYRHMFFGQLWSASNKRSYTWHLHAEAALPMFHPFQLKRAPPSKGAPNRQPKIPFIFSARYWLSARLWNESFCSYKSQGRMKSTMLFAIFCWNTTLPTILNKTTLTDIWLVEFMVTMVTFTAPATKVKMFVLTRKINETYKCQWCWKSKDIGQ